MIWHWLPPFLGSGDTSLNLVSIMGSISTFLLGLACGIAYWKTRRLLAPRARDEARERMKQAPKHAEKIGKAADGLLELRDKLNEQFP